MWFEEFVNLSSLDLTNLDTSEVTNMSEMFAVASAEVDNISFDLSSLNTENVTSMIDMFYHFGTGSSTIDIGDLTNWDTSKVTDMSYMFADFGNENTKMSSIGRLNIPNDVNLDRFAQGSSSFVGGFVFSGYPSSGEYEFRDAATANGSRIDLYYSSGSSSLVSSYIQKYGPDSDNHGNIYAIELTS